MIMDARTVFSALILVTIYYSAVNSNPIVRRSVQDVGFDTIFKETDGGLTYMRNLFNTTTSPPTQANAITSLPFKEEVLSHCGRYTFSLAGINTSEEYIVDAHLHLYFDPNQDSGLLNQDSGESYVININTKLQNGDSFNVSRRMEENLEYKNAEYKLETQKYYKFSVYEIINKLLKSSEETLATFNISIYRNIFEYRDHKPMLCPTFHFIYKDTTAENIPLLIVQSYDPKLAKFNVKNLSEQPSTTPSSTDASLSTRRRKRDDASSTIVPKPACQVHAFNVSTEHVLIALDMEGDVIYPIIYSAGLCGGECLSELLTGASNHAMFLRYVLDYGGRAGHQTDHSISDKYCVPIQFKPLHVLMETADKRSRITWINDMEITKCACIDYIRYT